MPPTLARGIASAFFFFAPARRQFSFGSTGQFFVSHRPVRLSSESPLSFRSPGRSRNANPGLGRVAVAKATARPRGIRPPGIPAPGSMERSRTCRISRGDRRSPLRGWGGWHFCQARAVHVPPSRPHHGPPRAPPGIQAGLPLSCRRTGSHSADLGGGGLPKQSRRLPRTRPVHAPGKKPKSTLRGLHTIDNSKTVICNTCNTIVIQTEFVKS
jgi:hypothetical protein